MPLNIELYFDVPAIFRLVPNLENLELEEIVVLFIVGVFEPSI